MDKHHIVSGAHAWRVLAIYPKERLVQKRNATKTISVKVRDAIRIIEVDGWRLARMRGSHRQYRHPWKPGTVTVAGHPSIELDPKTQASILRQAGLKR